MVRSVGARALLVAALPLVVAAVFYFANPAVHGVLWAVALVAVAGAGATLFVATQAVPRLVALREAAKAVAAGDLERSFPVEDDLLGEVAGELDAIRKQWRAQSRESATRGDEQHRLTTEVSRTIGELRSTVEGQLAAIEETAASLREMTATLQQIAHSVETLASAAEESSSSILEMAAANDEVSENMLNLAASVQESATSIEEMTFSIKEVAKNVEELSSTAEETSSSMNEMDISIRQVENNANETARLSEEVSKAAGSGAEAIQHTIDGINKIKGSAEETVKIIARL